MSTDLTKEQQQQSLARPDYIPEEKLGTEQISGFIRPPRIKIVQPQSRAPLSDMFNKGDVVLVPQNLMIAPVITQGGRPTDTGSSFHFVPLLFFPEWSCWNPVQMQTQLPVIRSRTFDPDSDLARKAKSMTVEKCPENPQYEIRYTESLNFLALLALNGENAALDGTVAIMSFNRGSYRCGSNLLSLIQIRKAAIFSCVFEAHSAFRSNDKGQWYVLDCANPSRVNPWISKELYEKFKELHLEYKAAHEASQLVVEYDDSFASDEPAMPQASEF